VDELNNECQENQYGKYNNHVGNTN